ncbi:NMDA receptor synaptonuclear signaling and neuronal migration factor [Electrophorus electricus]|uniref:NMDA receptor synaptonuclear signaling and neuronal migration factor n=1 Tax=Electrophorus electricus TaxID=8005 RepID=UPI0015CFD516|nr:NMDA receptor synaptonuclear signaling and neuronal migration factor [Electrophorus electricus]
MGTAVSKRKSLRNDAILSVAAKVRAARAFGEYLHTHPESRNGSDYLLSDTLTGPDSDSPDSVCTQNNQPQSYALRASDSPEPALINPALGLLQPPGPSAPAPSRLSLERSFSAEEEQQKCVECALQPSRVYTITGEGGMLTGGRGSKEGLELEVLKGARDTPPPSQATPQPSTSPCTSSSSSSPAQHHHRHAGHHHHGGHHHSSSTASNQQQGGGVSGGAGPLHQHHHHLSQPLQSSVSAHNIRGWAESREGTLVCEACPAAPSRSQGSLDLESSAREAGKQSRWPLERMCSVDRVTGLEREENQWYPKENMFSFQTATTTMQAISNFRKHLRMVGSRRMKAQTFAERRAKSFNRSWSDPTPVQQDSLHDSKESGELQAPCAALEEGSCAEVGWEEEREVERQACEGDDFIPPKVMLISSKVPKAEYVPNIIRRDDPSIIPILYDHEHATFDDILEEIEKRLTSYRRGSKIWRMLIFCQGGPGHLYLLKNKVATFAKVEKEEGMSQFWKKLSRFMSKVNPEPNVIHIMGCYVLGNPNGEKLFQKLKNLMRPYSITFESPLELSAQGKEMIETYFDFRLYRLWKTRQHSKLLDYEDLL